MMDGLGREVVAVLARILIAALWIALLCILVLGVAGRL